LARSHQQSREFDQALAEYRKAIDLINITENRMAHASEFPAQIKQNKLRVTEVPVKVKYDQYSKKKGQSGFDSVRVFFDLVLHKFFK